MAQMPQLPVRCGSLSLCQAVSACMPTAEAACPPFTVPKALLGIAGVCAHVGCCAAGCQQQPCTMQSLLFAALPPASCQRSLSLLPSSPLCVCRLNVDLANNFLPSRPANVPAYNLAMPPPQPALNAPGMVPC